MSRDELKVMDGGKCILEIRGARPFYSDKFDITKHKNYKLLSDYNKKNTFDIEKYLRRRDMVNLKEEMRIKVVEVRADKNKNRHIKSKTQTSKS